LLPPAALPRAPHSFPTRRSSDLPGLERRPPRWVEKRVGASSLPRTRLLLGVARIQTSVQPARGPPAPERVRAKARPREDPGAVQDRKSTRLNSSHVAISYAVFCL